MFCCCKCVLPFNKDIEELLPSVTADLDRLGNLVLFQELLHNLQATHANIVTARPLNYEQSLTVSLLCRYRSVVHTGTYPWWPNEEGFVELEELLHREFAQTGL